MSINFKKLLSKKIALILSLGVVFFASTSATAQAHTLGASVENISGKFLIDVGYDTPGPIDAGVPVSFDFRLFTNPDREVVQFTDVSVNIEGKNGYIGFYGDIKKDMLGSTGMVYIFPKSGSYDLKVFYRKDDTTLAQAIFPLKIDEADYEQPPTSPQKYWKDFGSGFVSAVLFVGLIVLIMDIRAKKKKH